MKFKITKFQQVLSILFIRITDCEYKYVYIYIYIYLYIYLKTMACITCMQIITKHICMH